VWFWLKVVGKKQLLKDFENWGCGNALVIFFWHEFCWQSNIFLT
jgi:hypothetical protein